MDENNEQFVAYFLPTPDTLQTRMEEEKESADFDPEQESVKGYCLCCSAANISPCLQVRVYAYKRVQLECQKQGQQGIRGMTQSCDRSGDLVASSTSP